ncbi:hypothetical protein [Streptomyces sp. KS 21]|uniref:hypothetical protein n=1 Tax=Streptomyces sp. KS 21 TaxID=2485150 RepID=UPI001063D5B6|nr:hypothetical protein [Streptomyces sp. KS 21]TDU73607.1 hypothetical protein EDD91_0176 [Streptomyces sp. KS 21]
MKSRISAVLLAGASLAAALAVSTPAQAAPIGAFMLKNTATGMCLQGSLSQSSYDTRGVPCNRSDSSQWWGTYTSNLIMANTGVSVCLVSTPNYSALTSACGSAEANGWDRTWSMAGTANSTIGSVKNGCSLGMGNAGSGYIGYCMPGPIDNNKRWTKVY